METDNLQMSCAPGDTARVRTARQYETIEGRASGPRSSSFPTANHSTAAGLDSTGTQSTFALRRGRGAMPLEVRQVDAEADQ
jgi:hypothetical protein